MKKDIKEKNCYFVLDPNNPPTKDDKFKTAMPDGSTISIPHYIFHEAPEVLLQPNLIGFPIDNIPQAIIASLQGIDKYYWSDLLSHIVISGGNLSYSGFEDRLHLELVKLLPQLGKIPKPKQQRSETKEKKHLKAIEGSKKKQDTCPHCGKSISLNARFCSRCGN